MFNLNILHRSGFRAIWTIAGQETDITEFDEALVKKLIEKITVFADHFTVEFKSGIVNDIEA